MDFDIDAQGDFFSPLFEKRPEITPESLKKDLQKYYLPFVKKLIELKKEKGGSVLVGVSAIQGVGKTTQGEVLEILLRHFGYSCVALSIDDHYLTHLELCELREEDPRFIRRGVTHDITLATRDLENLLNMKDEPILVSGYDKGANSGDGDRFRWINPHPGLIVRAKVLEKSLMINKGFQNCLGFEIISAIYLNSPVFLPSNMGANVPLVEPFLPKHLIDFLKNQIGQELIITEEDDENVRFINNSEIVISKKDLPNGWKLIVKKPDFIFYDGWMLGARSVDDEGVFEGGLPALDTSEHIQFAKDINKRLLNYKKLWGMVDFLNLLYVVDYQISLKWRDQAEEVLRKKGEGMTSEEIKEFVYYFWRSVHPAIHIKNLSIDEKHTHQVVIINDDHSVKEVLTPKQVKEKYIYALLPGIKRVSV